MPSSCARVVVAMPYDWPYDYLLAQLKSKHCLWMARTLGDLLARAVAGTTCTGHVSNVNVPSGWTPTPMPAVGTRAHPGNPMTPTTPAQAPSVVVPVLAARVSLRRRGFNPAAEIARAVATRLRLPVRPEAVCRMREASKQSGLRRQARWRAVAGAFEVSADLRGRHIALVDDVMTTGATTEAISQALRHAGAAAVTVWVVARRAR
jgi:predicted amidophosphoribosyltransferase